MDRKERYNNYSKRLRERFGGQRIQKISINGGFSCPNRDGRIGTGGCTFCNNKTFVPDYCRAISGISQQVEKGIDFFHHKYKTQSYLVYFQSYTSTYAGERTGRERVLFLKERYEDAIKNKKVAGIVIGTRPDCIDKELLDYLAELNKSTFVSIEYGVESTHDETLQRIHRGHDFACSRQAILATAERDIEVGAHIILGLPQESKDDMIETALRLNQLPIKSLKLHQLQLIRDTAMGDSYLRHPEQFHPMEMGEYIDLCIDFLEHLDYRIGIERFVSSSPSELLLAPKWGVKNFEFTAKLEKRIKERDTWQGRLLEKDIKK